MPAERSNFCRILGLNPYREDEYALSEIETRLEAKKEEWERTLQCRLQREFHLLRGAVWRGGGRADPARSGSIRLHRKSQ